MGGESLAKSLFMVSNIAFIAAAVFAALAVFFFIKFKIPSVVGDLSGRNARKSIAQMRNNNEKSGNKSFRPSKTNVDRVKLTDTMKEGDGDIPVDTGNLETRLVEENKIHALDGESTTLLVDIDATGLLTEDDETTLLSESISSLMKRKAGMNLQMIDEVVLIHTREKIS